MNTGNVPRRFVTRFNSLILVGVFIILAAVVAVPFYSVRSSSLPTRGDSQPGAKSTAAKPTVAPWSSIFMPLSPEPQPSPEGIATYLNSDCSTSKTDFNLGQVVCAKASGVPVTAVFPFQWHVAWVDPAGLIQQLDIASTNDATTYHFTPTSVGTWKVNLLRSNGAVRQTASFTVHDTAHATADVLVQKVVRSGDASVPAGEPIAFLLIVINQGPDPALNVHLVDSIPSGGTLVLNGFTQESGPACLPVGAQDCTIASLANGERAEFTAIYGTAGISPGTVETTARVTSSIEDPDNSNNNSLATFEVTTSSGTPSCTITCPTSPAPFNNDPGKGGHLMLGADFPAPIIATGATCGAVSTTAVPNAQGNYFFPIGISVITASTESGETCPFTVTVHDNEAPIIHCPLNIAKFESSPGSNAANVNFTVTATDNSGTLADPSGSATVSCDHNSGDSFTGGVTTVHCTATDDGNNSASCQFTVTINPDSGCVLTTVTPIVVNSDADACGANVSFTAPTGNGQCVSPITCDRPPAGSFFGVGETLVTCSDTTGGTTSFTVNVEDHTAPVPTLVTLPTITADCSASAGVPRTIQTPTGPKVIFEPPTATDNCGPITGETADPITYQVVGTYIVHWVYDDGHGNTTNQTQTIVVTTDTSPPVPDVTPLPALTDQCSVTATPPTATDACVGTVTATTTDPLTYGQGDFTITWHYDDGNGHVSTQTQQVHVHDVTAPSITPAPPDVDRSTGAGNTTCTVQVTDAELGTPPTATDNCSVTVTRSGVPAGNQFHAGTTDVVYTATDAGGNMVSVTQHVLVHDTTPPTITVDGANPLYVECHTIFVDPGATAHDNCGNFAATATSNVNPDVVNTYTITYNASDAAGNPATPVTRTVIVRDTTKPVITLTGPNPQYVECHTSYPELGAVAHDSCAGDFAATPSGSVNPNVVNTYTITYNATDPSGNAATAVQRTVIVRDTTAPTITLNGQTPSMWPPNHKYQTFGVTNFVTGVSDTCDGPIAIGNVVIKKVTSDELENSAGDGNTLNDIVIAADCKSVQLRSERDGGGDGRVYTIYFSVSDSHGNVGTATAKVVVQHNPGETAVDSGVHYTVCCHGGTCP
jgi:uncharacterized repeat protein (TIGR01451 family)